ncbi:terminase small subunit [Collimonas sp. PA-H2]|uniref:terminase small subunit n=1 Tax=Collimonas sp. PA-H2 TaxID=1881062 RepID=UPI000BF73E68|nr:terminase small subunit [Collimonas sp. PA-H2]
MTKVIKSRPPAGKATKKAGKDPVKSAAPDVAGQLPAAESAEQARLRRAQEIVNGFDLPPRTKQFVVEYTKDMNGTQAAIRAGYSAKTANEQAAQHLAKLSIKQAIDAVMNDRIEQGIFDGDMVISRWVEISQANPNSLTQYRRVNCRYCWGEGHRYQFTPAEMEDAKQALADANTKRALDELPELVWGDKGGLGFVGNRDPHPECPECWGEGVGRPFFTDTRKLGRESLPLYAGVKQTKDGLEIQMHNQTDALDKLARHFGLYKDKLADAVEKSYTREALEERFAGAMQRAQERQRQVDAERGLGENG